MGVATLKCWTHERTSFYKKKRKISPSQFKEASAINRTFWREKPAKEGGVFVNLPPNASPDRRGLKSKNVQIFPGYPTV